MSKRKSLNRRLSRFSKSGRLSGGSAVLDPDTEGFDDDDPLWWKNLKNNTTMQTSGAFNFSINTTKSLDSDTEVVSSVAEKEWWKVLDTSDSNTAEKETETRVKPHTEKSRTKVIESSSESEKEHKRKKKKSFLHVLSRPTRKSNAFLQALEDPDDSATSNMVQKSKLDNAASSVSKDKKVSHKASDNEDSTNKSPVADNILKSRPTIFKRRRSNKSENVFDNILREEKLVADHKSRKSTVPKPDPPGSSVDKQKNDVNDNSVVDNVENSITNSTPLKDNNKDASHISVSKEQTSVLKENNVHVENAVSTDDSSASTIVIKRKSRFLKRPRKSLGANAFSDVLTDVKNTSIEKDVSSESSVSTVFYSPKKTETQSMDISAKQSNSQNEQVETSGLTKSKSKSKSLSKRESLKKKSALLSRSIHNQSVQHDHVPAKNSDESSDESDSEPVRKPRSKFRIGARKSSNNNAFKLVIEDGENRDANQEDSGQAQNAVDIEEETERDENNIKTQHSSVGSKRRTIEAENNIEQLSLRVSSSPEQSSDEIEDFHDKQTELQQTSNENVESAAIRRSTKLTESPGTPRSGIAVAESPNETSHVEEATQNERKSIAESSKKSLHVEETSGSESEAILESPKESDKETAESERRSLNNSHTSVGKTNKTHNSEAESMVQPRITEEINDTIDSLKDDYIKNRSNILTSTPISHTIPERLTRLNEASVFATPNDNFTSTSKITGASKRVTSESSGKKSSGVREKSVVEKAPIPRKSTGKRISSLSRTVLKRKTSLLQETPRTSNDGNVDKVQEETPHQQQNLSKSQLPVTSSKTSNVPAIDAKKIQMNIEDFFKGKNLKKLSEKPANTESASNGFVSNEQFEMVKKKIDEITKQATAKVQLNDSVQRPLQQKFDKKKPVAAFGIGKKPAKEVDKAYIVNGKVYKQPRLPRPQPWATDRLYQHLWKCMEPKYKLSTRVRSERFVQELSDMVKLIKRRKHYDSYKDELNALMKKMAHLQIIRTREDFYHFCYDFLPYDFRVKVTPILMPGNVITIPYDPRELRLPLLDENENEP